MMHRVILIAVCFFAAGASAQTYSASSTTINGVTFLQTGSHNMVYTEYSDSSCSNVKNTTYAGYSPNPASGAGLACVPLNLTSGTTIYIKTFCDSTYGGFILYTDDACTTTTGTPSRMTPGSCHQLTTGTNKLDCTTSASGVSATSNLLVMVTMAVLAMAVQKTA